MPITPGMNPRTVLPPTLLRLAEAQAGVLARSQVLAAGVSDDVVSRLLREQWRPVSSGIYAIHRRELPWRGWCWAGVLIGGTDAVVGRAAAAHLNRLGPQPDQIAIWVGPARQLKDRWPLRFLRGERDGTGYPARTTSVRTILDLAAVQPTESLLALLGEAVGRRGVSPEEILAGLAQLPRHPRRRLLLDVLGDVAEGVRSPLEWHYFREVERAHGLPVAERQASPSGAQLVDAWYRRFGVVVELDGRLYHDGRARFRDFARDNRNALVAQTTLRYGWADTLDRPCQVARQVAAALSQRGWRGNPRDCRRCRNRPWV